MFTIGITLEKETFRVAILKKEKNGLAIDSLHSLPYGPEDVKLFYNLPPFHTGKDVQIISGLPSSDLFIRKLHLPLRERRKILAALPFQLESLIPFSEEKPIICPLLKPLSKQMTAVTVIATTQNHLKTHLLSLKNLDIEPDIVSSIPTALIRFAKWQFPQENRILSFDVRDQKMTCVLSGGSELILSQTLCLSEKEKVALEIERLSIFLKQKGTIDEETPWLLTGDSSLEHILSQIFPGKKLQPLDPMLSPQAISIGLALDGLLADSNSLQFCQKEFTPERTFQIRKKKTFGYFGFCMGMALLMGLGSFFMLGKKQQILADRLLSYMPAASNIGELSSVEQLQTKLSEWEKSLRNQKNTFPFVPTVPKISDILAWASAHPSFATELGGQKEGMEIKSLHYSLIKYPKIGEPSTPYTAQLDMEFTATTPRLARDFHDALLKGDHIVNGKKEIKWHTQNQTYNVSFELNKGIP